jgi:CspA family cold shock protein
MAKIMMFIDGTWLYRNTPKLSESYGGTSLKIDFGKLPHVLAQKIGEQISSTEVDVVRTHLFGSYAFNCDPKDDDIADRQLDFYHMLKEEHHYECEIYPIDFRGRRLKKEDRDPKDSFKPEEKCVDIALATHMLYFAAIPYAYDIAIAVVGDRDFIPMFQHVRRLGKRVAIASIQGSCANEYAELKDPERVKDFDLIWLDDLLNKLELKRDKHQLECESPSHKGDRKVWTDYYPRKGTKFFCDICRETFNKEKKDAQQEYVSGVINTISDNSYQPITLIGRNLAGKIKTIITERGFGFISGADGSEFFFHFSDLQSGLEFESLEPGVEVMFEIKKMPSQGKAGAAQNVKRKDN